MDKYGYKIITLDFLLFVDSSDDEIFQKLEDNREFITEARVIWIVGIEQRLGLMKTIAKYIDFMVEKINFISKYFLHEKDLIENHETDLSKLPSIDAPIEELHDDISKDHIFTQLQSKIQLIGFKISMKNIQKTRKFLRKNVSLDIKSCWVTGTLSIIQKCIFKSKIQNPKAETEQDTQAEDANGKNLLQRIVKNDAFFKAMIVTKNAGKNSENNALIEEEKVPYTKLDTENVKRDTSHGQDDLDEEKSDSIDSESHDQYSEDNEDLGLNRLEHVPQMTEMMDI